MNNKYKKIIISIVAAVSSLSLMSSVALAKSSNNGKDKNNDDSNMLSIVSQNSLGQGILSVMINSNGEARLVGDVLSISGSTISISSWSGIWLVNATNAKITPNIGGTSGLSSIKVGDRIIVLGKASMTDNSIIARKINDKSINPRNDDDNEDNAKTKNIKGTISNINNINGTFTVSTKHNDDVLVTVSDSNTRIFLSPGHIVSSFGDLVNGMRVWVKGAFNSSTNTFKALFIKAK